MGESIIFTSNPDIVFANIEEDRFSSVDERNLHRCKCLNFARAVITSFNTDGMTELKMLIFYRSGIEQLRTDSLINLEYLSISETKISELNT